MTPIKDVQAGLLMVGDRNWMGGVNYVRHLIKAVTKLPVVKRPRLVLLLGQDKLLPGAIELYQDILPLVDEVRLAAATEEVEAIPRSGKVKAYASMREAVAGLDFIYPLAQAVAPELPAVSWIPDFQHRHLPRFFTPQEIRDRDAAFTAISRLARMTVFSSASAEADFHRFFPGGTTKTFVLRFCTAPSETWYEGDPGETLRRYGLPERFVLCCNQFWAHKDHLTLFRALAKLKRQGVVVQCVCTGQTADSRVGAEDYFGGLMKIVNDIGLAGQVRVLGLIDRHDQIQLLRACQALIQPSLFEGWSSVVEDAKAFGKPIFLTDLPVHLEQAPELGRFFRVGDATDLAARLLEHLPGLEPAWGGEAERQARLATREREMVFALCFCSLVVQSLAAFAGTEAQA